MKRILRTIKKSIYIIEYNQIYITIFYKDNQKLTIKCIIQIIKKKKKKEKKKIDIYIYKILLIKI